MLCPGILLFETAHFHYLDATLQGQSHDTALNVVDKSFEKALKKFTKLKKRPRPCYQVAFVIFS